MTDKEILNNALNHKSGDIPIDFGSTAVTGMHVKCIEELRKYFGLEIHPIKVIEPYQMLGAIDEDLIEVLKINTTAVLPASTIFGFPLGNWKEWRAPWGQELLIPGDFNVTQQDNDTFIYPKGDMNVDASGHMPEGGFFFDTIIRQQPIDEDNLNVEDNLEEFVPISDKDLQHFKSEVDKAQATGRGIVATFGGTSFGDIALIPGPFLKNPKGIRDITEWYMSTAMRQDYVKEMFTRQLEIALENLKKIYAVVGNGVDVVFTCGTDFGTQTGSFCALSTYDDLWYPYYKKVNDWIHENTTWKSMKHCCGAVEPFMPHFIKSGFDIINPVQCSATGMDPATLKKKYGAELTFWGGGVDTQHTLPFGTPDEVSAQVLERCEIFGKDGGFVFDAIHNVQANTPVENIVAMFEAVHKINDR